MDPNKTLEEIRSLFECTDPGESAEEVLSRLQDKFEGLDQWLRRGGFLPAEWNTPARVTPNPGIKVRIDALPVSGTLLIRDGVVYTEISPKRWVRIGETLKEDISEEKT